MTPLIKFGIYDSNNSRSGSLTTLFDFEITPKKLFMQEEEEMEINPNKLFLQENRDGEIVEMNVGGRHMSTFLSTLTKYPDSMLAAMFSGRHQAIKDKDGRFFIDADGEIFSHLLNFLRFETMPPSDKVMQVKQYAEYFGIGDLKKRLIGVIFPAEEELFTEWKSNIPSYSEYLSLVKEQLITCDISAGFIFLTIKLKKICKNSKYLCYPNLNLSEYPVNICSNLQLDWILEEKQAKTLLLLLSHDLKNYGLVSISETRSSCCNQTRLFKIV